MLSGRPAGWVRFGSARECWSRERVVRCRKLKEQGRDTNATSYEIKYNGKSYTAHTPTPHQVRKYIEYTDG